MNHSKVTKYFDFFDLAFSAVMAVIGLQLLFELNFPLKIAVTFAIPFFTISFASLIIRSQRRALNSARLAISILVDSNLGLAHELNRRGGGDFACASMESLCDDLAKEYPSMVPALEALRSKGL